MVEETGKPNTTPRLNYVPGDVHSTDPTATPKANETPVITESTKPLTSKQQREIKLEKKSRSRLIESRALKGQYDQGQADSAIIKKAKNWFGRD